MSGLRVSTSRSEPRRWLLVPLVLALVGASNGPLSFTTLKGETVSLRPSTGKRAVILHFWATWCPTCVEEMDALDTTAESCRESTVRVVAVNVGEDRDAVAEFATEHRLGLEMLRDPRGKVWRKLSGQGLPINVTWTDEERRVHVGPQSQAWWQQTLAELGCAPADSFPHGEGE